MRVNLPVSNSEYTFSADQTLVSVTDMKGRIVYCNDPFVHVSGYSSAELLGQPHNIVRHPDMPAEAFRDMWATIQAHQPWTGLVKNRRKNGDYYWVQANATPMVDGDAITGYLSVRSVPAREAVRAAEQLYARMNAEAKSGSLQITLQHGQVVRRDMFGMLQRWLNPGAQVKMVLSQVLAVLVPLLAWQLGAGTWPTLLLGVVCAGLGVWASRKLLIAPLHRLVADANHLAAGDLSHPVQVGAGGMVGQLPGTHADVGEFTHRGGRCATGSGKPHHGH